MVLILLDDQVMEIFESPSAPPNWIEAIDVENGEYAFCDDRGQRFVGVITKPRGWFRHATFELRPDGVPDLANALALVDRAVALEPNDRFPDLAALRQFLTSRSA